MAEDPLDLVMCLRKQRDVRGVSYKRTVVVLVLSAQAQPVYVHISGISNPSWTCLWNRTSAREYPFEI